MMETKRDIPNIELRSGEVQELMGKIPPVILRVGISFILIFVILIYIACNIVKYPDIISFPIVARNVNCMSEICSLKSGLLIETNIKYGHVNRGSILAKIEVRNVEKIDTLSLKSPVSGIICPCDTFHENDYIEKNSVLCVVVDSINDKIAAKAYVPIELRNKIYIGMDVETSINNNAIGGKITSIADYANPQKGTYTITMEFESFPQFNHTIIWNSHVNAKIKVTERSVFEKFIKDRLLLAI